MSGRVGISKRTLRRPKRGRPIKVRLPKLDASSSAVIPPSDGNPTPALPASNNASLVPTGANASAIAPKPKWKLPKNSKVKKTAMRILALRLHGMSDDDIAKAVGLANATTVRGYIYRAGKNGWLGEEVTNPRDALDFDIMHKVVRNIGEALDSNDDERRDRMAVKVAEGTIFKSYDAQAGQEKPAMTMIAVKVEMPEGYAPTVREGAAVGSPNYIDGQVVEHESSTGS